MSTIDSRGNKHGRDGQFQTKQTDEATGIDLLMPAGPVEEWRARTAAIAEKLAPGQSHSPGYRALITRKVNEADPTRGRYIVEQNVGRGMVFLSKFSFDNTGRTGPQEGPTVVGMSAFVASHCILPDPVDWDGPVTVTHPWDGDEQEWFATDADDRFPGRFVAHNGRRGDFQLRITPGNNDTYEAPGFQWSVDHPYVDQRSSGIAPTRDDAAREACDAVDYFLSGEAEADAYAD